MSWRSSYYLSRKFWAGFYYRISSNSNRHSGIKNPSNKEQLLSRFIFISAFLLLSDQANQYKKNTWTFNVLLFWFLQTIKSSPFNKTRPKFWKTFQSAQVLIRENTVQYNDLHQETFFSESENFCQNLQERKQLVFP